MPPKSQVPDDKTKLDAMFAAMSQCAALHPDPVDGDGDEDDAEDEEEGEEDGVNGAGDAGEEEEEGMFDDAEEDQPMDQWTQTQFLFVEHF